VSNPIHPTAAAARRRLPDTGAPAPYLSLVCALGTHEECDEAEPPPAPVDLPLIYERCACKCHPNHQGE